MNGCALIALVFFWYILAGLSCEPNGTLDIIKSMLQFATLDNWQHYQSTTKYVYFGLLLLFKDCRCTMYDYDARRLITRALLSEIITVNNCPSVYKLGNGYLCSILLER